jgi:thiopurine S-methyltransferase
MEHEFWKERWKTGMTGWHNDDVSPLLMKCFPSLPENSKVMVPLCGKTLDMLWLASEGYRVLGVELSGIACESFFAENNLEYSKSDEGDFVRWKTVNASGNLPIEILQGDFFKLNQNHFEEIRAVYDRAALIALPLELREKYTEKFRHFLPESSEQLVMALTYNQNEMPGPPFSVTEEELKRHYSSRFSFEKLHEQEIIQDSPHLKEKGCTSIKVSAYFLTRTLSKR